MGVVIEKTDYAIHTLDLPFSKKTISFRTWNMREHKRLLTAYEGKDPLEIQQAILQILNNIVADGTNVGKLPAVEFDYLFLRARAKSIGEVVKIPLTNNETKQTKLVGVDLTKVELKVPENRNYKVPLLGRNGKEPKYSLLMKELTAEDRIEILSLTKKNPEVVEEIELALRCIDKICDQTSNSDASEQMDKLRELIEEMSPREYEVIDNFLTEMPVVHHSIDVSTVFPGAKGTFKLEGIDDFFE